MLRGRRVVAEDLLDAQRLQGHSAEVEHILVYSKQPGWQPGKLPRTAEMDAKYKNPDNDPQGDWQNTSAFAPNGRTHQGMVYAIQHPFTGEMIYPTHDACWRYQQDTMLEIMNGWAPYELRDLHDEKERGAVCGLGADEIRQDVLGIVLSVPVDEARKLARSVLKHGQWPRFYFTRNGEGGIRRKTYLGKVEGKPPTNWWSFNETGHTDEAKKELKAIFDGHAPFDTPKPTRLIERIIQISCSKDALVLDSFAGSGSTAHAVLNMNARDGGSRRFILVEMDDYADTITAERVRRVIRGYGEDKNAVAGIDTGFSYYELGAALFCGDGSLSSSATVEDVRRYVWYTETQTPYEDLSGQHPYLLGHLGDTVYYLAYEPGSLSTLDYNLLGELPAGGASTIIYADRCSLDADTLKKLGITYKQIPRQIARV